MSNRTRSVRSASWTCGNWLTASAVASLLVWAAAASLLVDVGRVRSDGASVLLIVEDDGGLVRRADAIVLVSLQPACDRVAFTMVPRDLVVAPDQEPLAVVYETSGARGLAGQVESVFDADIVALVTTDFDGVEAMSRALGPIPIELDREMLDHRTGFHAGPGRVDLAGSTAVAYLRSRSMLARDGDAWVAIGSTDELRMRHSREFLVKAVDRVRDAGPARTIRVVDALVRHGRIDMIDPAVAVVFAIRAWQSDLASDVLEVRPEQALFERRSPFSPDEVGATHRVRVADPELRSSDICTVEGHVS